MLQQYFVFRLQLSLSFGYLGINAKIFKKMNNIFPKQMNERKQQEMKGKQLESCPFKKLIVVYEESDFQEDCLESLNSSFSDFYSSDESKSNQETLTQHNPTKVQCSKIFDQPLYDSVHLNPRKQMQGVCEMLRDQNEELQTYKNALAFNTKHIKELKQEISKLKFENRHLKEENVKVTLELSVLREKCEIQRDKYQGSSISVQVEEKDLIKAKKEEKNEVKQKSDEVESKSEKKQTIFSKLWNVWQNFSRNDKKKI